jgi:hypothetical protein
MDVKRLTIGVVGIREEGRIDETLNGYGNFHAIIFHENFCVSVHRHNSWDMNKYFIRFMC